MVGIYNCGAWKFFACALPAIEGNGEPMNTVPFSPCGMIPSRKHSTQKGRKNSQIVSFLLDLETLAQIDAICEASAQNCKVPMGRSAWIKRAIARELAHKERSKRCNRHKKTASRQDENGTLQATA